MRHVEAARRLRHCLEARQPAERFFHGAIGSVALAELRSGTSLGGHREELDGRSVLLAARDQLPAALALIELDGIARRVVLCPPDLATEHLPEIAANAQVDAIVSDRDAADFANLEIPLHIRATSAIRPAAAPSGDRRTIWLLLTSGFRTYRFLPVFWREFFPRFDAATPEFIQRLLDQLAQQRFGTQFCRGAGVVRFVSPQRLRDGLQDIPGGRERDPHIAFFLSRNPGHVSGDELVCLTELCAENLTAAGRRMMGPQAYGTHNHHC